ncbi:MAG TPA: amino acid permease, partial [Polyangiaceae bacterium]|nr:amino acid permease [Polyangiaceae bacterium]
IKTQYLILVLIAASLLSVFLGAPDATGTQPHTSAPANGPSPALLFGIFFPAVTGFTAGVNMSGDLRNPKSAIPRGTLIAIAVGLLVYVGLAVFLAYRVPAKQLIEDQDVLIHISRFGPAVVAGIWGATLSSAIGSIMGAPRILQALSGDAITPRWFGRGYGKTNEPRNALVLAFAIAEGGILIAELDAIARIVSMVFLTTYGFLNFSAAIESWASPDFRPSFRIPKLVSILGAVTAVLVMIQLDLFAMAGATLIMGLLFFFLQRKQLELESGDAWAGIWSSLIRSGLSRLSGERQKKRNWRPIILLFRSPDSPTTPALRGMARSLVSENGIVTDFELVTSSDEPDIAPQDETRLGVFDRRIVCEDRYQTVENLCRYHGFAALRPNTVLLPWSAHRHAPERFCALLDTASELDFNLLLFDPGPDTGVGKRIDVWWRVDGGNLGFSIALLRFITREARWERAEVRLLLSSPDTSANDHLRSSARHLLAEARLEATIRVINDRLSDKSFEERVIEESRDADLTLVGLPNEPGQADSNYQERVDTLVEALAGVLLIRASSTFDESVHVAREAAISFLPPAGEDGKAELPELTLPETADLAREVTDFADGMQRLVTRFQEDCIQRIHARHVELARGVIASVEQYFHALEKAGTASNPRRMQTAANRALSKLLSDCRQALETFENKHLVEQSGILSERIAAFLEDDRVVDRRRSPEDLQVRRSPEDFEPRANDSDHVRGFKLRRRIAAGMRRKAAIQYALPVAPLRYFYFQELVREGLKSAVRQLETDTHQLVITLGKVLDSIQATPSGQDAEATSAAVRDQQEQVVKRLRELVQRSKESANGQQWALLMMTRQLTIRYAADVDRLDARRVIKKERRVARDAAAVAATLKEVPERWQESQARLVQRAELALKLSSFQHRLSALCNRERDQVALEIKNGILSQCQQLEQTLSEFRARLPEEAALSAFSVHTDFDSRFEPKPIVDGLLREAAELTAELPETVTTLSEESVQALEEGRGEAAELTQLPVRRLVQFLVESRFVGELSDDLARIPKAEQRAAGVAQDVVRLISFQLTELDAVEGAEKQALRQQLDEVLENGLERVGAERARLTELLPVVTTAFDEHLRQVIDGTNAYDLGATSANLEQHIRLHQGRAAVSGARGLLRRGLLFGRHTLVNLVYRRSEGVLLARQLQAEAHHRGALVDRVAALVEANSPRPEVLEA